MTLHHLPYRRLSHDQVIRLLQLQDLVWPKAEAMAKPIEERIDSYFNATGSELEVFLIEEDDGALLAHAEIFPRDILTTQGQMQVMGLASVCTPPDRRGEGTGKRIVLEAFKLVDAGRFSLSLFQTGVPDFYTKLGARTVDNTFINSRGKDGIDRQPWWNPYCMIYPGSFEGWPGGEVDLLGPGY